MPVSHFECSSMLKEAQEAEYDNREMSREADLFLNKRDGQWEPQVLSNWTNRPRYTFDECNPIIDSIMGDLEALDYGVVVSPTGGKATKRIANYFGGIIRQIESISKARSIYDRNARITIGTGFSAWRVVTDWKDNHSFNQDLMIKHIPNAHDCVWFDPGAVEPTMSDADMAWVLTSLTRKQYEEYWPQGSGMSVGTNLRVQAYSHKKPDETVIGEYLYKKEKTIDIALLSNNMIVPIDNEFALIYDELQRSGINIVGTRTRKIKTVHQRFFDGADWLSGSKESIFEDIPVIPVYGNFTISENKVIYWGAIEKLMDPQRIINYSESRKIEEGALAPKGKIWMTKDQAKSPSVKKTLETLNTNNDPVQFYDHTEGQNPPSYIGSPPSNPGLMETTQTAQNYIQRSSGMFDEARGTAPARRSGIAIEKLQTKSDSPKQKWKKAMELSIAHTYGILIKAIPIVYKKYQQMLILNPDATEEVIEINKRIKDSQTGEIVVLNDLSVGKYAVTCVAGPAFQTKQSETVNAIVELAAIDPSILQLSADVLLNNINAPGMDKIAARKRRQMVLQGLIPVDQMTKDELKAFEAVNSKDNMSPIDKANLMIAQAQLVEVQGRNQERGLRLQLDQQKLELNAQVEQNKHMINTMNALTKQVEAQAKTLKYIREAIGVDAIVTPQGPKVFNQQLIELKDTIANN